VIVPTRNEKRSVGRLLASLRLLRYKSLEVIVADYMSSDNTVKIARSFGAHVAESIIKAIEVLLNIKDIKIFSIIIVMKKLSIVFILSFLGDYCYCSLLKNMPLKVALSWV